MVLRFSEGGVGSTLAKMSENVVLEMKDMAEGLLLIFRLSDQVRWVY